MSAQRQKAKTFILQPSSLKIKSLKDTISPIAIHGASQNGIIEKSVSHPKP